MSLCYKERTFNSLYGILNEERIQKLISVENTFNSLYGIQELLLSAGSPDQDIFQFPLWDTLVNFNQIGNAWFYFQFPLWDT